MMLDNLVKGKLEGYFCVVKENMAVPVAMFLSKADAISWVKTNPHQLKGLKVEFHSEKDNPCWGCAYRAYSKYDWQNICLLDEDKPCIKEL